jgi:hypothetical protein
MSEVLGDEQKVRECVQSFEVGQDQLQGSNIGDVAKKLAGAIILQALFRPTVRNECNCSSAGAMVESCGVDRSVKSNDLKHFVKKT